MALAMLEPEIDDAGFDQIETDPRNLDDAALTSAVRSCARLRARVDAAEARLLAEFRRRRGARSAGDLLRSETHVSSRAARARVEAATVVEDRPAVAAALENGEITVEHTEHLARAAKAHELDEARLLSAARAEPADEFGQTVRTWMNEQDDDGGSQRAERQRAKRKACLFTRQGDGMTVLHAELDPESGAIVRHALGCLTDKLWRLEHGRKPVRDRSTPEQRMADAVVALAGNRADDRSDVGSDDRSDGPAAAVAAFMTMAMPSVLVTVDYDAIAGRLAGGRLSDGSAISADAARRMSCDAEILPIVLDGASQPLELGRNRRLPSPGLKRAVIERDRTCRCGCGTPPEWCQIHHIIHWSHFGPTNLDNLVLVCSHAHHQLHEGGWVATRGEGGYTVRPP